VQISDACRTIGRVMVSATVNVTSTHLHFTHRRLLAVVEQIQNVLLLLFGNRRDFTPACRFSPMIHRHIK